MLHYEWTKRLGQQHFAESGKNETLCGKPMLGNNYAKHLTDEEKTPCNECAAIEDFDHNTDYLT